VATFQVVDKLYFVFSSDVLNRSAIAFVFIGYLHVENMLRASVLNTSLNLIAFA